MSFKTKKQEVINFSKRNWKVITGTLLLGVGTTVVVAKAKKDKENIVVSDKALDNVMPYEEYYESEWEDRLVQVKTGEILQTIQELADKRYLELRIIANILAVLVLLMV